MFSNELVFRVARLRASVSSRSRLSQSVRGCSMYNYSKQLYWLACVCAHISTHQDCIAALRAQFPKSICVRKLIAMRFEAVERFDEALESYEDIITEDETNAVISYFILLIITSYSCITTNKDEALKTEYHLNMASTIGVYTILISVTLKNP